MTRVLAVDQGTTGTKSLLLEDDGAPKITAAVEHRQYYPRPGWVEHDAGELLAHVRDAVAAAGPLEALGIANQGETVVAWDADSGRPLAPAIVWQDARTRDLTERLKAAGAETLTLGRAGLPLDPYFSASKLRWLLDHVPEARRLLARGRLRLGTTDAFFLDRLAGIYATDVTTASRTSLMDLRRLAWDPELCALFGVPIEALPEIRSTTGDFGEAVVDGRRVPITASAVDQQAALFGHRCHAPGRTKISFGTGAFALANVGPEPLAAPERGLLATVAWKLGDAPAAYAVDGGIYSAGAAVDWARRLGLFSDHAEIDAFEAEPAILRGLAFVPALSGLACPYWDRTAAGLLIGVGPETSRLDLCQAVLEGVALRAAELVEAIDGLVGRANRLSIDGGLANNRYFGQFLADATAREVVVPETSEVTALGCAQLAALGCGAIASPDDLPVGAPRARFAPARRLEGARRRFADAVRRSRGWRETPDAPVP